VLWQSHASEKLCHLSATGILRAAHDIYTVELLRGPTGFSLFVEECRNHLDGSLSMEPAKEGEADENAQNAAKHEQTRQHMLLACQIEKKLEEDRAKAKAALEGAIADSKSKLAQSDLGAAVKARADAGDRFKDLQELLQTGGELESSVWSNGKLISESQIAEELANLDKEIKQAQAAEKAKADLEATIAEARDKLNAGDLQGAMAARAKVEEMLTVYTGTLNCDGEIFSSSLAEIDKCLEEQETQEEARKKLTEMQAKAKAALEGAIADSKSKLAQSDLGAAVKARADAGDRFKDLQELLQTGGELESSVWSNGKLISESQIAEELANLDKEIKQAQASAFEAAVSFTLTLDVDFNSISSPEEYKTEFIKDIALASNTAEVFFKFEGIRAGSIINDMLVAPGGGNPASIVQGLIEQLGDPNSRLMQGKWTSKSMTIESQASKSMAIEPKVGKLNARFQKRQQREKKMQENASNINTQLDQQKLRPGLYAVVLIFACVIGMWAVSPSNINSALKPDVNRAPSPQWTGVFLKGVDMLVEVVPEENGQVPELGGLVGRGKPEEVKPGSGGILSKIYRAAVRQFKKSRRSGLFRMICLSVCLSVSLSLSPFLPFARSLARSLSLSF
jgi:hypothetical protein